MVTITKRGQPLATVQRARKAPFRSSEGILAGKGKIVGDIIDMDDHPLWRWDCLRGSDSMESAPLRKKA